MFLTLRHAGMIASIDVHDCMDLKEYERIIETENKAMTYTIRSVTVHRPFVRLGPKEGLP